MGVDWRRTTPTGTALLCVGTVGVGLGWWLGFGGFGNSGCWLLIVKPVVVVKSVLWWM